MLELGKHLKGQSDEIVDSPYSLIPGLIALSFTKSKPFANWV